METATALLTQNYVRTCLCRNIARSLPMVLLLTRSGRSL